MKVSESSCKYARISPSKVKIVIDLIRGKSLADAMNILHNTNKKASALVLPLLKSAAANAENNHQMDAGKLYVHEIYANKGITMKRYQPRAKGAAYPILKRTSHITVKLAEKE
jgi:large subunit ribosomal protein L22